MGLITNGERFIPTAETQKKNGELTVAQQNRMNNPYGSHTVLGALSQALPQIICGATQKFGDLTSRSSSEVDDGELSALGVAAQNGIDSILDKYGCTDISEIAAKLEATELYEQNIKALNEQQLDTTDLTNTIASLDSQIKSSKTRVRAIDERLRKIESLFIAYDGLSRYEQDVQRLKSEKQNLLQEKKTEEERQIKLNEQKNQCEAAKALIAPATVKGQIIPSVDIKADLQKLQDLQKELKRAEGKNAIENLTNETTANVAKLVDKYQQAKKAGDTDKANKIAKKLREAKEEHEENNTQVSPTIQKLFDNLDSILK